MDAHPTAKDDVASAQHRRTGAFFIFGVCAAIAVAMATLGAVWFVRNELTTRAENVAIDHTEFVAHTIVADHLKASDFAHVAAGDRLKAIDRLVRREILTEGALRVKLYSSAGLVVYSSDPTLAGSRTDDMHELRDVLAGHPVHGTSMLNHEGGSGPDRKVLESYAPVYLRTSDGGRPRAVGVFEIYSDYSGVTRATRDAVIPIALILSLAMLLIYAAPFPMFRRSVRALKRSNDRLMCQTQRLSVAQEETISRLSTAVGQRDAGTGDHIMKMSRYCGLMAEKLGMDADRVKLIRLASQLHDVGKIATPDVILQKPGALTPPERAEIEKHAAIGHSMLRGSESGLLELAATIALTHHEHWDGNGYPNGLIGAEIPIEARIAAIADVFDALTSDRVYRPAMTVDEASEILRAGRGTHFDPELLDLFFDNFADVLAIRAVDGPRA